MNDLSHKFSAYGDENVVYVKKSTTAGIHAKYSALARARPAKKMPSPQEKTTDT